MPNVRSFALQLAPGVHVLPATPSGEHLCVSVDQDGHVRGVAFVSPKDDAAWQGVADYTLSRMTDPSTAVPPEVLGLTSSASADGKGKTGEA